MWEGRELPKEVRKEEKKGLTGWHKGLKAYGLRIVSFSFISQQVEGGGGVWGGEEVLEVEGRRRRGGPEREGLKGMA